jgi:quercetin dioxygenase-like cupin family protein
MEIRYAPGAHSGDHLLRHPGRHLFVVLEGELTFEVGFSEHRLAAGDSISFGDFQPHRLRNEGPREARALICVIGDDVGDGTASPATAPPG